MSRAVKKDFPPIEGPYHGTRASLASPTAAEANRSRPSRHAARPALVRLRSSRAFLALAITVRTHSSCFCSPFPQNWHFLPLFGAWSTANAHRGCRLHCEAPSDGDAVGDALGADDVGLSLGLPLGGVVLGETDGDALGDVEGLPLGELLSATMSFAPLVADVVVPKVGSVDKSATVFLREKQILAVLGGGAKRTCILRSSGY